MKLDTFRVGLGRQFSGKPSKTASINFAVDWTPSKATEAELIGHICQGYPFTAQFRDGYRKTSNFICSDFVAADFDGTMTLDEARAVPFIQQYCSFIYTTPSHTDESNRFRAVFLLRETITDPRIWADCLYGLAIRLGSDRSIKDAGRMFFGSPKAQLIQVGGRLPAGEVRKLVNLAEDERSRSRHPAAKDAAICSSLRLETNELVQLKGGTKAELGSLAPNTSVLCPYHADEHPSAFVVRSNSGSNGIHCMTCNATFWTDTGSLYDFYAFDRLVDERRAQDRAKRKTAEQSENPFEAFFPPDPSVIIHQTKFLPALYYQAGITAIKSPKGSGKTEALKAMIEQIEEQRFPPTIAKSDRPASVLLIGHRQSLIKEAANRLGLDCYLDDEEKGAHRKQRYGYAICLDSLHKIAVGGNVSGPPPQYDVVILDESEQVLSHLLSATLRERVGMPAAFASLEFMIRRAKAVYALDADLGLITLHALKDLRSLDWNQGLRIIHNRPLAITDRRTMRVYKSKKDLQNRMLDAIREGKRCFVASNSKATVDVLEELLRKEFGPSLKMVAITSDNSRGKFETNFVQNIQTEFLKTQVLICSPSLGTGIDISFPEGRREVDEVFGFFSSHVNKHTDIDQQLARVRNPGSLSVWFDGSRSNFETNLEVVKRQLALANYVPTALNRLLDDDGNPSFDESDPLLNIAAHVMVAQRSSQNGIFPLFERLRRANGWDCERVEKQPSTSSNRKWKDAQRNIKERRINGILSANELDESAYAELAAKRDRGDQLSKADRFCLERFELERAYGRPVDRQLIEMDNGGLLRRQIAVFRNIFGDPRFAEPLFYQIDSDLKVEKPLSHQPIWYLIATVLVAAGLVKNAALVSTKRIRAEQLQRFKHLLIENRVVIEEILQTPLRSDFTKNPVRQLNVFLGYAGLRLVATKRRQRAGRTNVEYEIDATAAKSMMTFL
jgi:Origin of replication binding protein